MKRNKKLSPRRPDHGVGARLMALRSRKGISLRALAKLSRVTFGALSHIENDRNSPSVSTLKRIVTALDTTLADFFADENPVSPPGFVLRSHRLTDISPRKGIHFLSIPRLNKKQPLQIMSEIYAPGAGTGEEGYSHTGEEGGFCIKGTVELTVDGKTELLNPGDAYYFKSGLSHSFRNPGRESAQIISACTPPSF